MNRIFSGYFSLPLSNVSALVLPTHVLFIWHGCYVIFAGENVVK